MQDSRSSSQKSVVLARLRSKAKQLNRAGSWGQEALKVNSQIVDLDPQDVAALTRRARCRRALKDFQGAEKDYRQAQKLSPGNVHIATALYEMIAEAHNHAKKVKLERNKKRQRSGQLQQARTFAEAYRMARYAMLEKPPDHKRAIVALEKAVQLAPPRDANRVQVELGAAYRKTGRLREARTQYDQVLARDPNYAPALTGKAAALLDQYQPELALKLCDSILLRNPEDRYAKRVKARAMSMLGHADEANWIFE